VTSTYIRMHGATIKIVNHKALCNGSI